MEAVSAREPKLIPRLKKERHAMRLLLAAISVFCCLLVGVAFLSWLMPNPPIIVTVLSVVVVFFVAVVLVTVTFNARGTKFQGTINKKKSITELEEQDLLVDQEFRAKRAFQIEEFEDEGAHYFIQLEDNKVLFLTGQYLYDYHGDPRRFPNTHFIVRIHREKKYVVEIKCLGSVIEPECLAPGFTDSDYENDQVPSNLDILQNVSYENVLHRCTRHVEK